MNFERNPVSLNYTQQDVLGVLLAFFLFPLVLVIPGYVIGWGLNLFDFRKRLPFVQIVIGTVLSNACSPILFFLAYRLGSVRAAMGLLWGLAAIWLVLLITQLRGSHHVVSSEIRRYQRIAFATGLAWVMVSLLLQVDIQMGDRLYFTVASNDLTTRVSVVDAITRTGVPPVNPGYYPGHAAPLTFLYYFWYILGSLVDQIGGGWVSSYHAMLASSIWSGLSLVATLALYLRLRNPQSASLAWRAPFLGAQLLLVGGLDFIPVTILMIGSRLLHGFTLFNGGVESWNTPIMSWLHALIWVPHHVSSALACITGMMAFLHSMERGWRQKAAAALVAGVAFASGFGLSVWVTLAFGLFFAAWMIVLLLQGRYRSLVAWMASSGILALALAYPFIADMLGSNGSLPVSLAQPPVELYVRPFVVITEFLAGSPGWLQGIMNLLLLPVNYMFELGFFFFIALLWLQRHIRSWQADPYRQAEILLVATIMLSLSFLRSSLIYVNDLGIRGWLPAQFILIVWGTDLLSEYSGNRLPGLYEQVKRLSRSIRVGTSLSVLLTIGLLTTGLEAVVTRSWPALIDLNIAGFPTNLSPDTHLGQRTFAARQAYDFIRENLPEDWIVQNNPTDFLDRPGGLYGDHQMVIADRTAYGVGTVTFLATVEKIGKIFRPESPAKWAGLDSLCSRYLIQAILVKDTDPLWGFLPALEQERPPLYKNGYYALFSCGV